MSRGGATSGHRSGATSDRQTQLVAGPANEDDAVVVGIEIDGGFVVWSLLAAGYENYAINPMASARSRDRHATSGASPTPVTPR